MPQSDVPGEQTSPTQPFPTKPPAFTPQGVSLDDAFDLTPELKAAAQAEMKKYRIGPLFTPPSMQGTITRPERLGRRELGRRRLRSRDRHALREERRAWRRRTDSARSIVPLPARGPRRVDAGLRRTAALPAAFNNGVIPFFKPPYAQLIAINLNTGTIAWRVPFGDMPALREDLPKLGVPKCPTNSGAQGPPGAIVTKGGLVFIGGGDAAFHAIDKATGHDLWSAPRPRPPGRR